MTHSQNMTFVMWPQHQVISEVFIRACIPDHMGPGFMAVPMPVDRVRELAEKADQRGLVIAGPQVA